LAAKYDSQHAKSLQQLTEAIQDRLDFIGVNWVADDDGDDDDDAVDEPEDVGPAKKVRLLDYACGTGMISRVRIAATRTR
jgi:hypothetical protein